VPANLHHFIVVQAGAFFGLLKDGSLAFSLQLSISEALLLELRWNGFVFYLCIHHAPIVYG
jgi:hypothetical protein